MLGTALSVLECEDIALSLIEERSAPWSEIAWRGRRHPSTIIGEVEANAGRAGYRPAVAGRRPGTRRCRPHQDRLRAPGLLRDRVTTEFRSGLSPEAIWAELVTEGVGGRMWVERS